MRMVSKRLNGKNLAIAVVAFVICATAYALSPAFTGIDSSLQGLNNAEVSCEQYSQQPQKKMQCDNCKQAVDRQKSDIKSKLAKAKSTDQSLESKAAAGAAQGVAQTKASNSQTSGMTGDKTNQGAGQEAKNGQASNFADLAKALDKCKSEIETACQGESQGDEPKKACEAAAKQAQTASSQAASDAQKMGENAKKDEGNGKGMEMPKMPEMPKQEPKAQADNSGISTATNTATKVADSNLSGNQFGANRVGIGGSDEIAPEKSTAIPNYRNGGNFDSGISASKSFEPANSFAGGGTHNGSGSSSMGGSFGGMSGSSSDDGSSAAAATPVLPAKTDDIEAFSNGGARPSYLGMKSKGGELADLGLETATPSEAGYNPSAEEGDRSLASTDQNAGIHTEQNADSLFSMIRERLREVGRRGSI